MTEKTDTEKAFALLRCVEADVRKFVVNSEGIDPSEYFEDVHAALTEAMMLLGIEVDPDDEYEFEGLIESYERKMDSISLEDFDPITHKPQTN